MSELSLPNGWATSALGDLTGSDGIFRDGDWVETKDQDPNGEVRLIQLADIGDGRFLNRSCRFLTAESAQRLRCTFLKPGDVLIARMPDPLGRACIFPGDSKPAVTAVDVCILRPHEEIDRRWLMWAINAPQLRQRIYEHQSGSTRKRISRHNLGSITLPLPPSLEQEKIARELDSQISRLDSAASTLNRALFNLKRYRAAVLKAACEGRLVPTEAELARTEKREYEPADQLLPRLERQRRELWVMRHWDESSTRRPTYKSTATANQLGAPMLPEGWALASLEQLALVESGQTPPGIDEATRTEGDIPWFRVGDMNLPANRTFMVDSRSWIESRDLQHLKLKTKPQGTIIFPKRGGAIATNKKRLLPRLGCLDLNIMGMIPVGEVGPYLWWWFAGVDLGSLGDGSNVPQINLDDVVHLLVPLPPLREQVRIIAEIEVRFSLLEAVEDSINRELDRAKHLRQSILRHAFEGQLVPQNPNEMAADALLAQLQQSNRAERVAKPKRFIGRRPPKGGSEKSGDSSYGETVPTSLSEVRRNESPQSPAEEAATTPLGRSGKSRSRRSDSGLRLPRPSMLKKGRANDEPIETFADLPREEQVEAVWDILFGRGFLERDEAIRTVAEALRERGLARFQRLRRGGALYQAIEAALARGLRAGDFDRPQRGKVRAVLRNPRDYPPETWSFCLLESFDHHAVEGGEAIRAAAEWARQNLGLEYGRLREDGVILRGLRAALEQAIRRGKLKRIGRDRIQRAGGT